MSEALTMDRINFLLSTTKQRGIYEQDIQAAVDSGEFATDFSALAYYEGKDVATIRQSVVSNIAKHTEANDWPKLQVVVDRCDSKNKADWRVILVNLDALAVVQAEQAETDEV